ncbi:rhodanese-like domain-containing protein [Bacteroidota bacterium]
MKDFFQGFGMVSNGILHVSPKETLELCKKGAVLVDVREDYMNRFKMFDVDKVIFCPLSILKEKYKELPKDKPMIFADAAGLRSKEAIILLQKLGIKNMVNMTGGIVEWERDGCPLVIDKDERLTGSCMCMLRPRHKN